MILYTDNCILSFYSCLYHKVKVLGYTYVLSGEVGFYAVPSPAKATYLLQLGELEQVSEVFTRRNTATKVVSHIDIEI